MSKKYDLVGERFGSLIVEECLGSEEYKPDKYRILWKCKCDCGKEHITHTSNLTTGKI